MYFFLTTCAPAMVFVISELIKRSEPCKIRFYNITCYMDLRRSPKNFVRSEGNIFRLEIHFGENMIGKKHFYVNTFNL